MRALDVEASSIRTQRRSQILLNSQRNSTIFVAENEEAGNVVPWFVLDVVGVHATRLMLQGSNGLGLSFRINVVVEDVVGGLSIDIVSLFVVRKSS